MSDPLSRRQFLKRGCFTAAAVGITLCGGTALVSTIQPKIDMPSSTVGKMGSGKRILVAYATKAGSTAEVAVRMAETLSKQDLSVDVQPVTSATDIGSYDAVLLGSAIRTGNLLPEAMDFVEANRALLLKIPFSVFVLCMTLETDNEDTRKQVSAYLDPLRALVSPTAEGLFAGVMDPAKLRLFERAIMAAMKTPLGDYRNWDQITAWAEEVPLVA
jgi:menaquinone-dependent protoporphyrinogen oxidase